MNLYNGTIEIITNIVLGENNNKLLYRGWSGLNEYCQNSKIPELMLYEYGCSRFQFVNTTLKKINNSTKIEKAILHLLDRQYFLSDNTKVEDTLNALNDILNNNDYKIVGSNWNYKIIKINETQIKPHHLAEEFEYLQEFIQGAWKHLDGGDYWEVITNSRTIIEITLKEICKRFALEYIDKDIIKAFKIVKDYFKMDAKNQDYPDYIKSLITNNSGIINNIANARNENSTSHAPRYKPKKHHAKFVLECAISLSNFLISIMELKENKNL